MMPIDASSDVTVDRDGGVGVVSIARPQVRNCLNSLVIKLLTALVIELQRDPNIRSIVITGEGDKAFCAGADLDELDGLDPAGAQHYIGAGQRLMSAIAQSDVPVIAAVNGLALGGGFEMALASTFIVACDGAQFALPETRLGLIPGFGGTQRLARLVGSPAAAFLSVTGRRLSAARAYELGVLAIEPMPRADLMGRVREVANDIRASSARAVAAVLAAQRRGIDGSLANGLALEAQLAAEAISSADGSEGVAAFLAKRTPEFGSR